METFKTPQLVAEETGLVVPEQQAYLNLIRTAEVLSMALAEMLENYGLSGKQYNVLRAVRRGGEAGLPVSRISEQMTDPRADVTRLMDRLVRDGFIERSHDRMDRRIVRVTLTEKGRSILADIDAPILDLHRSQFAHMRQNEIAHLTSLLRKARGEAP